MEFWYRPTHPLGLLLAPLGWLYARIARLHGRWRATHAYYAAVPVISIGNLTVGGTGKTLLAAHLAQHFAAQGHQVAIVSRGTGGKQKRPLKVDATLHTAHDVGDEPMALTQALAHQSVAVWVGRNRPATVKRAEAAGATLIVLDDGFQRQDVARTANVVLIDAARGLGNGRCLPAGPLREPATALGRATFAVLLAEAGAELPQGWQGTPSYRLHVATELPKALRGKPLVAFAGLGRPDKFFNALSHASASLAAAQSYPDHHRYTQADLTHLKDLAHQHKAALVTTPKDATKLPPGFAHTLQPILQGPDLTEIENHLQELLDNAP